MPVGLDPILVVGLKRHQVAESIMLLHLSDFLMLKTSRDLKLSSLTVHCYHLDTYVFIML